jgi:hypothetical protein
MQQFDEVLLLELAEQLITVARQAWNNGEPSDVSHRSA